MAVLAMKETRDLSFKEWLIPAGILLVSFVFRVIQLDTAFFGPEQAWIARASLQLADLQHFPTHMYPSSANYSQLPLTIYLTFIPFLFSDSVFALLNHFLLLNLLAVGLCWWFVRRYWGLYVATVATLVYACMPWAIFLSLRIWPNTLLPPFVLLWAIGCGLAFAERKPGWLKLAWAAAWLALQLHVSGILLLGVLFVLMWIYRPPRGWRHALIGSLLALLPALPWFLALFTGAADFGLHLSTSAGRHGIQISFEQVIQFLTARDLAANLLSGSREILVPRLNFLQYTAPLWLTLYFASLLFVLWRLRQAGEGRRPLYLLLFLWCVMSLSFTFFASAHYTLAYYLPVLPAPCIALAILMKHLGGTTSRPGVALSAALLVLCLLNLNAVWIIDQQINEDIRREDPGSHAWSTGDYTPPLNWQLKVARQIRGALDAGDASELILVFHVDKRESSEYLRWPFEYHLRDHDVRVLDSKQPHLLYPQGTPLFLWNERESDYEENLMGFWHLQEKVGPFHLFKAAAGWPAPVTQFQERPVYENGLQLVGYDELKCEGNWTLHWSPGPADEASAPMHFFVHLLDGSSEKLAQRDLRVFDPGDWREGDRIVTSFEFGRELRSLPIETLRVGLYFFSDETNSFLRGINALDEKGRPRQYAVDIPLEGPCV
ncbi:MAG: hypothetical protein OXF63_01980 [Anaerolineaceae bacterium]|nr:hypothetical protein [Anaerolineaceae bacterium]